MYQNCDLNLGGDQSRDLTFEVQLLQVLLELAGSGDDFLDGALRESVVQHAQQRVVNDLQDAWLNLIKGE